MKKSCGREKPKATHAESQPASMRAGWLRETVHEVSTVWASTSMYGLWPPTASASFVVRNPRESAFEALLLSDVFAVFGTKLTPLHLNVATVAEILKGPSEQSSTCLFQYFFRIRVHFLLSHSV